MRTSLGIRRATTWLWGIVAFDIALIFVLAGWRITPADIGWALVMVVWLLLSVGGTAVGLTICYRRHFARWWAWLLLSVLWLGGALVVQGFVHIPQAGLSLLSTMVFLFSWLALFVALCIRLYQGDFGIALIGWTTVICVWSAVLMWRAYGDLIEAMFQAMERPGQASPIGLLNLLFSSACCLIPIALLSFTWHTCVLLWREKKGETPPCGRTP
jgi:hypothetical protein